MKEIPIVEALQMNRHERRRLGKANGIKIPSIQNIKVVKKEDIEKDGEDTSKKE